jgi:hypothetical protein
LGLFAGVVSAETTITINGETIRGAGNSVIVDNNTVVIDGKVVKGSLVEGSARSATEIRELEGFSELQLNISANVTVTAGEIPRCTITADDNILPLILTENSEDGLRISVSESYVSGRKVTIAVQTPLLAKAEVRGSGRIDLADVARDRLALVISGSGDITAKGKVTDLMVTINGSGDVNAAGLEAATATVTVNGSGDADILAVNALTAIVRGSGKIRYVGTPDTIQTSVLGSGEIVRK